MHKCIAMTTPIVAFCVIIVLAVILSLDAHDESVVVPSEYLNIVSFEERIETVIAVQIVVVEDLNHTVVQRVLLLHVVQQHFGTVLLLALPEPNLNLTAVARHHVLLAPGDAHAHVVECVLVHTHFVDVGRVVLCVIVEPTLEVHTVLEVSHARPEPFAQHEVVCVQ